MAKFLQNAVLLAVVISAVQSLRWIDCGSKKAKITKVTVTDCESTPICILKKGSKYTIAVDFTPTEDVSKATTVVHGILAGVPVPFPVDNPDACKDSGMTCPVASGTAVSYHSDINIKTSYPKVKVVVKWEVKDQDGNDLACVTLPAEIESAGKKTIESNHLPVANDKVLRFQKNLL